MLCQKILKSGMHQLLQALHICIRIPSITPGIDTTGRKSITVRIMNNNFNTKKVLMYKYSSSFLFAVSEMEFFTMSCKHSISILCLQINITPTIVMTDYPFPRTQAETDNKTTHNEHLITEKSTLSYAHS